MDDGSTHPVQGRKSKCWACGYQSHHYGATVCKWSGGFVAYDHAEAEVGIDTVWTGKRHAEPRDGEDVAVSWCCGVAKRLRVRRG
jgi:hypothetical protein